MAKDPAFLFYYDRFISGTYSMSNEEVGAYIRLLCIQANRGFISEKDINNTRITSDLDVRNKFVEISPGVFRNEVLYDVMEDRKKFTESRRNNRLGKVKDEKYNKLVNNTSKSLEKLVVNKDINVNKDKINIEFGVFWDLYDKKVGNKDVLLKKWCDLTDGERELTMLHIPQYKAATPDKKFRKDPSTYLNNKSFNDEIIPNGTTKTNTGSPFNSRNGGFQILADSLRDDLTNIAAGRTTGFTGEI